MSDETLLNWGSYDVDNFGDLLFPFLVEHYLGHKYREIIHVSPTGSQSIWPDAVPTCTVANALKAPHISGLIVGGGNLISWTVSSSINYVENSEFARIVHPSFSWVPYVLLAKYGIPYAYNFVGVAKSIPMNRHSLVKLVVEPSAFMSCRDSTSARYLRRAGVRSRIVVGLDSAIGISRVFPKVVLSEHYRKEAKEKYGIPPNVVTAVLHIKKRYLRDQHDEVARIIGMLRKIGIHAILLPLGMCHRDEAVFDDPRIQSRTATCIRKPESLIDMLSLVAISKYYIGSSLHGAIASLSYGNNVVVVANEKESGLCKFSGFLSQVNLSNSIHPSWKDARLNLEANGLKIFHGILTTKIRKLTNRTDPWGHIYERLHGAQKDNLTVNLDQTILKCVHEHYAI